MNTATRGDQAGGLRVSDADRDRVISELSEHFQAGRLTAEEFDERSGRALRARTESDLAELLADLPTQRGTVTSPGASQPMARPGVGLATRRPVVALAAIVAIVALASVSSGLHAVLGGVPVLLVLFVVLHLVRRNRRCEWPDRNR
jgi:hypothetical protein